MKYIHNFTSNFSQRKLVNYNIISSRISDTMCKIPTGFYLSVPIIERRYYLILHNTENKRFAEKLIAKGIKR